MRNCCGTLPNFNLRCDLKGRCVFLSRELNDLFIWEPVICYIGWTYAIVFIHSHHTHQSTHPPTYIHMYVRILPCTHKHSSLFFFIVHDRRNSFLIAYIGVKTQLLHFLLQVDTPSWISKARCASIVLASSGYLPLHIYMIYLFKSTPATQRVTILLIALEQSFLFYQDIGLCTANVCYFLKMRARMSVSDHNSSLIYCANTKGIREMGGGGYIQPRWRL